MPTNNAPNSSPKHSDTPQSSSVARLRNGVIALLAILLSTLLFIGTQMPTATASLASLSETSTPLNAAMTNNKPSLIEFYANWCTSCQAMAPDMAQLKKEYGDRINFVMLNVDNSKWLPEVLRYRVDGIPHFVFMSRQGEAIANAIGEQPKSILSTNLEALVSNQVLPYVQSRGRISEVDPILQTDAVQDNPRSHGAQVVAQ